MLSDRLTGIDVPALTRNPESRRIVKFIVIGVLNTVVGYGSFFILSFVSPYLIALIAAHIIGVLHSYLWNKFWTFKSRKHPLVEIVKFNLVYLVALITNILLLVVLVDRYGVDPRIGQLVMLPIITILSYVGHRYWSFKP